MGAGGWIGASEIPRLEGTSVSRRVSSEAESSPQNQRAIAFCRPGTRSGTSQPPYSTGVLVCLSRYSLGVMPATSVNARWKADLELKPAW